MSDDGVASDVLAGRDQLDAVDLPDGRRLVVVPARASDADALAALYDTLPPEDLFLRFFTGAAPSRTFVERWVTIADQGGFALLAWLVDGDSVRLVAEAGYSVRDDGDGELGITVDPAWRGGMGPWLLAVLLREAARRDVPNLHAEVQLANRRMLAVLRHRRTVVADQPDLSEVRLVVSTTGGVPSWPPRHDRPRILVESRAGHWVGEDAARRDGFDLRTCRGPSAGRACPLLTGGSCGLVDGADAIVVVLPGEPGELADLAARHADAGRGPLVFAAPGEVGDAIRTVDDVAVARHGCADAVEVAAALRRVLHVE